MSSAGDSGSEGRIPDGVPDFTGPAPREPEFLPCYQHPDRNTGITCQRCRRPICMQCMQEASVGFQCPDCAGTSGADQRRQSRGGTSGGSPFGARSRTSRAGATSGSGTGFLQRLQVSAAPATWSLVAVTVLVALIDLVTRGLASGWLALSAIQLEMGQWWRLVTFGLSSASLFSAAINALIMVLIGRSLEPIVGSWRFVVIFLTGCLVGGALFVIVPYGGMFAVPGASAGTIGLIAASAAVKLRMGQDIRFDLVLLGLLVVLSFVTGFGSGFWLTRIGGVLGGGGATLLILFTRQRQGKALQVGGLIAIWVASFALVWGSLAVA